MLVVLIAVMMLLVVMAVTEGLAFWERVVKCWCSLMVRHVKRKFLYADRVISRCGVALEITICRSPHLKVMSACPSNVEGAMDEQALCSASRWFCYQQNFPLYLPDSTICFTPAAQALNFIYGLFLWRL